jgi:predicted ATPase
VSTKSGEPHAAVSLARLRRDQGRHAEARDLLAPVYGWFTEGFNTPDLKEAKALLGELTRAGDWHVPKSGASARSLVGRTVSRT